MARLVVITCGKSKADKPAPAAELYVGKYFRASLAYARTLTTDEHIRVLSAKHGFVRLDQIIAPYQLVMNEPGAISHERLRAQARSEGLTSYVDVVALVGKTRGYAAAIRAALPRARFPLADLPGRMGGRLAWLRSQVEAAA